MLNQVVSRKQGLTVEVAGNEEPQPYVNYSLLVEDGAYSPAVVEHVKLFKQNFNNGGKTGPYTPGTTPYSTDRSIDNTSGIFRKLMKDYGHRQEVAAGGSWLVDASYIGKVIDRDTLAGTKERIPKKNITITADNADYLLNDAAGNTRNDTGLYELYRNVVERFVDGMIVEAERYAGIVSESTVGETPTPQWYSRSNDKDGGYGPTGCVTTGDDKECAGSHGTGMSYSWGGKQKVEEFNKTVSAFKAPKNSQYDTVPTGLTTGYKGDLYKKGTANEGYVGEPDDEKKKKWAGLIDTEEAVQQAWLKTTYPGDTDQAKDERWANRAKHEYYKGHWAGIDCMGLVLRSISKSDSLLLSVALPDLCYNEPGTDEKPCTVGGPLGSDNSIDNLATSAFNSKTEKYSTEAYSRIAENVKEEELIKKGDLVLYHGHIAIVYSDRWGESEYKTKYDIIHAYSPKTRKYDEKIKGKSPIFARKVMKTGADIKTTIGFGRIKLWE